jgi:hypothetical protein
MFFLVTLNNTCKYKKVNTHSRLVLGLPGIDNKQSLASPIFLN